MCFLVGLFFFSRFLCICFIVFSSKKVSFVSFLVFHVLLRFFRIRSLLSMIFPCAFSFLNVFWDFSRCSFICECFLFLGDVSSFFEFYLVF